MRKSTIALLVGTLAIIVSLTVGSGAFASSEKATAGTVVFIHDQEPPDLNRDLVGNGLYATSLVVNNIWYGCQIYNDKADLVPKLCAGKPTLVKRSPQTIQFTYKPTAVWSDGKQVTCNDYRATWQAIINPKHNFRSRTGWEDIRSVSGGNGKKCTIVMKKVYADWEVLASAAPYAAHVISGQDFNTLFKTSIPVSSGPWQFGSWQKGTQLTVVKNPRFRADKPMVLDRVVFRYILDTNARFQALKANEGQVMEPQGQLQIADFLKDSNFVVQSKAGFSYEHLDIQFGAKGHLALKQPYVRQALMQGINRPQIASALWSTIAPGLPTLQSLIFKTFETGYTQHFKRWPFSQNKVISTLKARGCTGGPDRPTAGNNNIFSCPNVGRLSFRFATTTGNQLRALTFEIIQRQLKSVGIELVPRFQVAGTLFGTTLPSGDWDIIMFTWVQGPTSKITAKDIYSCGGELNYMNYCNRRATTLMNRVAAELNGAERLKMLNQAEALMAADVPSIPMFVRPVFVIRKATVKGPVVNPTTEGSTWNANFWTA